jgi:hypothetical protein
MDGLHWIHDNTPIDMEKVTIACRPIGTLVFWIHENTLLDLLKIWTVCEPVLEAADRVYECIDWNIARTFGVWMLVLAVIVFVELWRLLVWFVL